jgi:hypothetical protein
MAEDVSRTLDAQELVSVKQTAKILDDITSDGVRKLSRRGRLPAAIRIAGQQFFRLADVEALRAARAKSKK